MNRRKPHLEGTIELKYCETKFPNLKNLLRGTQKAALLDYYEAGGRKRFALCYTHGEVFLWNTEAFREAIVSGSLSVFTSWKPLEADGFAEWLMNYLEQ